VDPRASLDDLKRKFLTLPGLELQPLGRPARSQSLYQLCYPSSPLHYITKEKCICILTLDMSVCISIYKYNKIADCKTTDQYGITH
jgi:hypothetical protein